MPNNIEEMDLGEYKGLDMDQAPQILSMQEALLQSIYSKLPPAEIAEEQLAILRSLQRQIDSQSTETQFVWNMFLQVAGIIFVILFGVFAVLSYIIGRVANGKTSEANKLGFLSICFSSNSTIINSICEDILSQSNDSLPSLATAVFGQVGPSSPSKPKPSSSPSSSSLDGGGGGAGGIIGALFVLVWFVWFVFSFIRKMFRERFRSGARSA